MEAAFGGGLERCAGFAYERVRAVEQIVDRFTGAPLPLGLPEDRQALLEIACRRARRRGRPRQGVCSANDGLAAHPC
jgi:hypothetical protein